MSEFKFFLVFVVLVIVGALYERNRKRKSQGGESAPIPAQATPSAVAPVSLAGRYALQIVAPDRNEWGDGTHPYDAQELAIDPAQRGQGYRLAGTIEIDRAENGALNVVAIIHGRRNPATGSHSVQMVPLDGREIQFPLHGAWCYLMFGTDGTVTGRVFEPEGWLAGGGFTRHNCWKYGDVVGSKA